MLKIAISSHNAVSKSTMLGHIKHFYEYCKHTATILNSTKLNLSLALFSVDCMFSHSHRSIYFCLVFVETSRFFCITRPLAFDIYDKPAWIFTNVLNYYSTNVDLGWKLRQSRDKEMNVSTKQNNYTYFYHACKHTRSRILLCFMTMLSR
jgi:hypothetical protein